MKQNIFSCENRLIFFGLEKIPGESPIVPGEGSVAPKEHLDEETLKTYTPERAQKIRAAQDRFDKQTKEERVETEVTESIKIALNGLDDIREGKFEEPFKQALAQQGMKEVEITMGPVYRDHRDVTVTHKLFDYTVEFRALDGGQAENLRIYKAIDWKALKGRIQSGDAVLVSKDGKSDPLVYKYEKKQDGNFYFAPEEWIGGLRPLTQPNELEDLALQKDKIAHVVTDEDVKASQAEK